MEKDLTQKGQFLRCLIRLGGGGLTPNETLSHSNGKFVFDHGPKDCTSIIVDFLEINIDYHFLCKKIFMFIASFVICLTVCKKSLEHFI